MRTSFSFLLVFLLIGTSLNAFVNGEDYPLPGSDYNIGVKAEVMVDLNVTLVNAAHYPKFVVVNPRYDFIVHRKGSDEFYYTVQEDNRTVYYLN
ncbi:MAG TPA: hypothetical protein EYH13_05410, partial [Thermococcus paralvinellae]|nr:hypothetical protein [Thermococcus paralvinellae]